MITAINHKINILLIVGSDAMEDAIKKAQDKNKVYFIVYLGLLLLTAFISILLFRSGSDVTDAIKSDADQNVAPIKINSIPVA
jgi:hypothetical protein